MKFLYIFQSFGKGQSTKSPHSTPEPPSSPGSQGSAGGSNFPGTPPPKSASKLIRKSKVLSSASMKKRLVDYMGEEPKPHNDTLHAAFNLFEQDVRENVKPELRDDLIHKISNTIYDFKKEDSPYIDVRTIPNYNPLLATRSFQVSGDNGVVVESTRQVKPQPSRYPPSATVSVNPIHTMESVTFIDSEEPITGENPDF